MSRSLLLTLMLAGCAQHVTVLDEDTGPRGDDVDAGLVCEPPSDLPLCGAPILDYVSSFGGFGDGGNAQPIVAVPDEPFAGLVTILAVSRTDGATRLVLDHDGIERTVTIPLTLWDPPVAVGEMLVARLTSGPIFPQERPAFFLRTTTDELRAGWIRAAVHNGQFDLSGLLHTTATDAVQCYQPTGGPCMRGLRQRQLYLRYLPVELGVPSVVETFENPIEVTVISFYDDGWIGDAGACAIGLTGGAFMDVRPAPP